MDKTSIRRCAAITLVSIERIWDVNTSSLRFVEPSLPTSPRIQILCNLLFIGRGGGTYWSAIILSTPKQLPPAGAAVEPGTGGHHHRMEALGRLIPCFLYIEGTHEELGKFKAFEFLLREGWRGAVFGGILGGFHNLSEPVLKPHCCTVLHTNFPWLMPVI